MMNLKSTELIVGIITFILVYCFSISIAGAFRAWVAKQMGDRTAEDEGFLTLNPLAHIDGLGIIFLCVTYFGWSRFIPIDAHNIDGSVRCLGIKKGWRFPKLLGAYLSDSFIYFTMAFTSLITLIMLFGPAILYVASSMLFCSDCMTHLFMARAFPDHSSITVVVGFILIALAYLSIVIGVLDLIINICHLGMALLIERSPDYFMQYSYVTLFAPMILIFCFSHQLRVLITGIMLYGGLAISYLLGFL